MLELAGQPERSWRTGTPQREQRRVPGTPRGSVGRESSWQQHQPGPMTSAACGQAKVLNKRPRRADKSGEPADDKVAGLDGRAAGDARGPRLGFDAHASRGRGGRRWPARLPLVKGGRTATGFEGRAAWTAGTDRRAYSSAGRAAREIGRPAELLLEYRPPPQIYGREPDRGPR